MKIKDGEVIVWTSIPGQLGRATLGDADCLQTLFGGQIDISIDPIQETVRVHANDRLTERKFGRFLSRHVPNLKPRLMRLSSL